VEKLIEFAELEQPLIFNSHGCLRGAGRTDFEELSNLADQMKCMSDVLTHDNSRHGVIFGSHVADQAWDNLVKSRSRLRMRYATDEKHMEGVQPIVLEDCEQSERNARAFHFLLDYILGVMAWWLVRCADSGYWRTQILATLAQWAVKMKIIARDPVKCAESSLSATSGMIEELKIVADANDVLIKIGGKKKDVSPVQSQTDYCNLYIEEKLWIRDALKGILGEVLLALAQDDKSTAPADFFEICTMIFRKDTEPDRGGRIWTGMGNGDVGVSSNLDHISFCYSLTSLLNLHINKMKHAQRPPQAPIDEFVKLSGYIFEEKETRRYDLQVYSMDHIITLLIPLLLMQPFAVKQIGSLMSTAMAFMDAKEILRVFTPPPIDFALELALSTHAWLQDTGTSRVRDPDITSLSESPLNRSSFCKFMRCACISCTNNIAATSKPQSVGPAKLAHIRDEYTAKFDDMMKWRVRSSDIVVFCRVYVRCVQGLAIVLVLGGLAVPFSVGERITGVDPFQIATYTWLLAGFLLISAKSVYVDDWPWNDFLQGHVKCRSVSDLSKVSGIDAQIVLLFLLRNERKNLLVTDGPYNGMFDRTLERRSMEQKRFQKKKKKDKDVDQDTEQTVGTKQGFSIDEPSHVNTLLASGIVVLKVRDKVGEHLICIDGRQGMLDASRAGTQGNWMTCPNFNSEQLEKIFDEHKQSSGERDVYMVERVEFQWVKVLGVYVKDSKFG
jgi:hypothetical protein